MFTNLTFLSKYNNLDEFQLRSFELIDNYNNNPKNQLVCAPTGSGKSLIAEYAIYHTVKIRNKKVIFTSPIKALSNQKFNDFNNKFKEYNISMGILTGDNKYFPNADCIILTTEILLNELKKYLSKSQNNNNIYDINIDEFGTIIFDEVHYINDVERGGIWEEAIMNIPKNINIIMLSATLSKPNDFAKWISSVQYKPTEVIVTENRVVPLNFNIYFNANLKYIPKNKQDIIDLNSCIKIYDTSTKKLDIVLYDKIIKYNDYYSKLINYNYNYSNIINNMLLNFNNNYKHLYPILFFVLSKNKCYQLASSINIIYNDSKEQNDVIYFINDKIKLMNCHYLENIEQFKLIKKLAIKGIGIHHSGLIPIIKEIIELLYEAKLIKILFATETFAVGLNMPTKTVIFADLFKFNRLLYSHEFIQMAGRSGRRNIDTEGYVILLPQLFKHKINSFEINNLLNGKGQLINSKLIINESYILRLLDIISELSNQDLIKNNIQNLIEYTKTSLLSYNNNFQLSNLQNLLDKIKLEYDNITFDDLDKIYKYANLKSLLNNSIKLSKQQNLEYSKFMKNNDLLKKYNIKIDYDNIKKELNDINDNLKISIQNMLDSLLKHDMLYYDNNNNIITTNKGLIASYILDGNSLIITEIITDNDFINLDSIDIINILATVVFDEYCTDSILFNNFKQSFNYPWINIIDRIYNKYIQLKEDNLLNIFNFDYIYLLDEFLRTSIYKSNINDSDYLYEGNFIRMINRLLNLLIQIKYIAEITKNINLMNKINESIVIINTNEWLIPKSIYLKMSSNLT